MTDAYERYEQTLAWLYRLEARAGMDFRLERVRDAAVRLGSPERAAPVVHVAGTNGKGSTAAMAAAVLGAGGRRVGLYTSPHLVSFRERIVVDGVPIAADEVVKGVARLRATLGDDRGLAFVVGLGDEVVLRLRVHLEVVTAEVAGEDRLAGVGRRVRRGEELVVLHAPSTPERR